MTYTEQELEEAKAYLRDRLRNEQSMSADVQRLLEEYAAYLLQAMFLGRPEALIDELIQRLVEQLLADCELLAVDEHDRKDAILLYMNSERGGMTLEGRVRERVNTFYNELFAVYMAGELLGKTFNDLLPAIKEYIKHPWDNELVKEAREKQKKGELSGDADFEEPHFGKGTPISSLTALDRMLVFAVADSWMYWQYEDALARGAKGYYVVRGSSYPCDICDAHTGIFYPIGNEDSKPQYHLNCCCIVVYSYVERL